MPPLSLEQTAAQCLALREIAKFVDIWIDPDESSRRTYWLLISQYVSKAQAVGCSVQDIFDALAISRGLKSPPMFWQDTAL